MLVKTVLVERSIPMSFTPPWVDSTPFPLGVKGRPESRTQSRSMASITNDWTLTKYLSKFAPTASIIIIQYLESGLQVDATYQGSRLCS